MVKTQVLFFGATADIVGSRHVEFEFPDGAKAAETLSRLVDHYPRLAALRLRLSVNQQYALGNEIVKDGDELAVFTAVSGG